MRGPEDDMVRDAETLSVTRIRDRHAGGTAIIIACGPSLADFRWERLRDVQEDYITIGVNRASWRWPTDYWFSNAADRYMLHGALARVGSWSEFVVRRFSLQALHEAGHPATEHVYEICRATGCRTYRFSVLDVDRIRDAAERGYLFSVASSAVGAVSFAQLLGIRRVYLLGVDLQLAADGTVYFDREWQTFRRKLRARKEGMVHMYWRMRESFRFAAKHLWADMEITTVSGASRLDCFSRCTFEQFHAAVEP